VQKLCVTLLLGLSSDPDHHVRAAAVRALGCCVLYPCLREVNPLVFNISAVFTLVIIAIYKSIFSACIVSIWNSLPNSVVDASTVNTFKARLDKFLQELNFILQPI